jgi:amino acid adenylation domain-containing protein
VQFGNSTLTAEEEYSLKENKEEYLRWLNGGKIARASFSQERLWFLDQLGFGNQYHIPAIGEIEGLLNSAALERALNWILKKHESLRTQFRAIEGTALQYILPEATLSLEFVDSAESQNLTAESILQEFIERRFDLEKDLLFRVLLIRLNPSKHILCMNMHHIISDGWSMKVLVQDLQEAYDGFCKGEPPVLNLNKIQYSGFSSWQRERLKHESVYGKEISYWSKKLTGYADLELPTDFVRTSKNEGRGDSLGISLTSSLGERINQLAQQQRTTSFTIFTAAVFTVLSRYAQQNDICLGMPVANRNHEDLEQLIGFFVNTVILRIQREEETTVAQLLNQVHQTILEAQDHQELPVERILDVLKPERNLSRTPIFQVLISYTPYAVSSVKLGEATIRPVMPLSKVSKFDLTFSFTQQEDQSIFLAVEYSSELFQRKTIEYLCDAFQRIVDAFSLSPDEKISCLSILSKPQQEKIISDGIGLKQFIPAESIQELFAKQASRCPDQVAIESADFKLSYSELERRSTLLAGALAAKGILPGDRVAICMDRSIELIVGIFSVLKAGAAYVPLDSSYPEDRLLFMLEDSEAKVVLCDSSSIEKIKTLGAATQTIIIPNDLFFKDSTSVELPKIDVNNLAYLMYTSGSTGIPKGVMVSHQNVVNHNLAAIERYGLTVQDKVLQFSSSSFDIFVEEVFPTLLSGATLVMMNSALYRDHLYLKNLVKESSVTILNLPTAYWHTLSDEDFSTTQVRLVIIGGEQVNIAHARQWRMKNPSIELINTYGPTETTVISLWHSITESDLTLGEIPIGQLLPNTQALILDSNQQLVPDGTPGELYIGGSGVSQGYWKREELTRDRFIKNPFGEGIVYRTGDRVRRRSDGVWMFLGRMDQQAKIRGHRIEPGEVEAALLEISDVAAAAVLVLEENGNKQLAAFYAAAPGCVLDASSIKRSLTKKFPEYLVPTYLTEVDRIPLTENGKTDYKALAKTTSRAIAENVYVAPSTEEEKMLANIWQSLLPGIKIGAQDNFFHLGGHSLLAIQLVKKVEQQTGVIWPLTTVFENQILAEQAMLLHRWGITVGSIEQDSSSTYDTVRILRKEFCPEINIILPGMPGWVNGYQELAAALPGNGAVFGLELPGSLEGEPLNSIEAIAAYQLDRIKKIAQGKSVNFYAHSFGGTVLYELLRQLSQHEMNVQRVVLIDSFELIPYNLSNPVSKELFCFAFMKFTGLNESRVSKMKAILNESTSSNWEENIVRWTSLTLNIDQDIIQRLWKISKTSLTMSYSYDQRLPHSATLVKARGKYERNDWGMQHWQQCFYKTHWIESEGDHFSLIKNEFCEPWLKQLSEIENREKTNVTITL